MILSNVNSNHRRKAECQKSKLQLPTEEEIRDYLIENISKEDYEEYKKNL